MISLKKTTKNELFNNLIQRKINKSNNKLPTKLSQNITQNWNFTPFPKYLFPSEKKSLIRSVNNLYFQKSCSINSDIDCLIMKTEPNIEEEIKGDVTKKKTPAFTFGTAREDCKLPVVDLHEKVSPSVGDYDISNIESISPRSLKYSFNKTRFVNITPQKFVTPGPGAYHHNKLDCSNQGKIPLSNYVNSPISRFGSYKEEMFKEFNSKLGFNVRPEPATYNINKNLSMFNGDGKYQLSYFRNSPCKKIGGNYYHRRNLKKFFGPGPGTYNHHSIFIGQRYSK